ncbi:xanthine dehydrogenase family protein molybdopterin-binding subunit [Craurococcus roseus]|uniref:Xanthine dehydrogenase family protein molybdopterin-binding subunit n=1 Tax=Craurococcus roseus TaxID=77585 RepID=A0ABN1F8S0_9PROT
MPEGGFSPIDARGTPRIDGRAKVTGGARYPSDMPVVNPAWAFLVTSAVSRGRIARMDLSEARAVPGVFGIMTHEDTAGQVADAGFFGGGGYGGTTIRPLEGPEVRHDGEIVAVALADSYETAREAGRRVRVEYEAEEPSSTFGSPGVTEKAAKEHSESHKDPEVGDADGAFAAAPVKVEARYGTPTQHHNAIELFTTTASWADGKLTVHEPSQFVHGLRNGLAKQFGMDPNDVRVVSEYIGGAFGGKGALTHRTALVALAAKRLGRPVKLVPTRDQCFTIGTYRAETRQEVKLAAGRDGKLQAFIHEGWEVTSRADPYKVAGTQTTSKVYACPNVRTKVTLVHADRNTPGFMRSPPEVPYMFGLESAMDELAHALKMDPVELRRVNDTDREPIKGLPYTSRSLMRCYDAAAQAFGWAGRNPEPRSTRRGEWLVGWGCATAIYPTFLGPATARVTLTPQGHARVQTAGHDIGTGLYTVLAIMASERLGLPVEKVAVEMGDTELPPAPVAGGSNNTASLSNAVVQACEQIRARVAEAAARADDGPLKGRDPSSLRFVDGALRAPDGAGEPIDGAMGRAANGAIEAYVEWAPEGTPPGGVRKLHQGMAVLGGGLEGEKSVSAAFGAEFVEVRVHERTREVRVPRIVGAFAAGRVVNPRAARSQLMGGMIWGIGSALHEATEIDERSARYVNDNLAEYLIPVNADIGDVEVIMLPEEGDGSNPLGIKGLGELGNVGTNAAVANAVFHATGVRVRDLPIRLESLL